MQPVSPTTTDKDRCHHGEVPSRCLICRRDHSPEKETGTTFAAADRERPPANIKFWLDEDEPKAMRAAA